MRFLSLLLLLLSGAAVAQEAHAPRPVVTEIVSPQSGLASNWVGTVTAPSEIDLGFLRLGTLAERVVDVGDTVSKGDVLARLDASDLQAQLQAAQAGVSIAEANLHTATDAYERVKTLADRGVTSASALEDTQNDLSAARAALDQARAEAARAEDARDYANLRAPIDGVVTTVRAEPGATLDAGQALMKIAATGGREVVISLSEEDAAGMAESAAFSVRLLANPDVRSTAVLDRIDPVTQRASRTRSAHLTLDPDAPEAFRLGTLTTVTLSTHQVAVTTLPTRALIAGSEPPTVWRVDPDSREVEQVTVETGPVAGGRVVILSGVETGDEIVIRGVNLLEPGQVAGRRIAPRTIPGGTQ